MLSRTEQETIINFNKEDKTAYIWTYEKTWQRHLENKLKLIPVWVNSQGGKEYEVDKSRIKMPRGKWKLSRKQKAVLTLARNARHSPEKGVSRENLKH